MEYVYSAMLLHSAKKEINEQAVTKVLEAASIKVDSSRVKALIASLKDINISEAIEKASIMPVGPAQTSAQPTADDKKTVKKEEKEEEKSQEEAAEGLGSLFG